MPLTEIQNRAREFVAHYRTSGLRADDVATAWQAYPDAAAVPTEIKIERLGQIARQLEPLDVDPHHLVRLVALNPQPVEYPASRFVTLFAESGEAMRQLGQPHKSYMKILLANPELAGQSIAAIEDPLLQIIRPMQACSVPLTSLGRALEANPALAGIIHRLDDTGVMDVIRDLEQRHGTADAYDRPDAARRAGMRQELNRFMSRPLETIREVKPDAVPASAFASPPPADQPAPVSPLSLTTQMLAYLKPYGVAPEQARQATQSWPAAATLTFRQARGHVREVVRYFDQQGLCESDYVRSLCRDLPTGLQIMATPKGEVSRYFDYLSQQTGAGKAALVSMLCTEPKTAANPDLACSYLQQRLGKASLRAE